MKLILVISTFIFVGISLINPLYPNEQFLQHLGTTLIMIPLIFDIKRKNLPNHVFITYLIFVWLHIVAARYIYSFVPYNDWIESLTGWNMNLYFEFKRNHFDRFIHFSFGLLLFPFTFHLIKKYTNQTIKFSLLFAWIIIQFLSMFYEIFEWCLTLVMSTAASENYNGQQGDVWDAHKDMTIAMLGSTITLIIYLLRLNKKTQ